MIRRYRKKPIEIDAVEWTGENLDEVAAFLGEDYAGVRRNNQGVQLLLIRSLENPTNPFVVPPGWKVIRGVEGEHYACRPDIFAETYEPVS